MYLVPRALYLVRRLYVRMISHNRPWMAWTSHRPGIATVPGKMALTMPMEERRWTTEGGWANIWDGHHVRSPRRWWAAFFCSASQQVLKLSIDQLRIKTKQQHTRLVDQLALLIHSTSSPDMLSRIPSPEVSNLWHYLRSQRTSLLEGLDKAPETTEPRELAEDRIKRLFILVWRVIRSTLEWWWLLPRTLSATISRGSTQLKWAGITDSENKAA